MLLSAPFAHTHCNYWSHHCLMQDSLSEIISSIVPNTTAQKGSKVDFRGLFGRKQGYLKNEGPVNDHICKLSQISGENFLPGPNTFLGSSMALSD